MTATPRRRDGRHPILEMQLGPVRYAVDAKSQAARRPFDHRLIVRDTAVTGALDPAQGIQAFYGRLAGDERRHRLIPDDVVRAMKERERGRVGDPGLMGHGRVNLYIEVVRNDRNGDLLERRSADRIVVE